MPNNDGTGPMGQGTMTGRGLGRCRVANNAAPNNQNLPNNEADNFNQNQVDARGFRTGFNRNGRGGNFGSGRGSGRGRN